MSPNIWNLIKGFSSQENWGEPRRMNGLLLLLLDTLRSQFRERFDEEALFVVHYGFSTRGHSSDSQHYRGNAVDFHIETGLSFIEQVAALSEILADLQVDGFVGFGIYPMWNTPGFHLDARGSHARWGRVDTDEEGVKRIERALGFTVPPSGYVALDSAFTLAEWFNNGGSLA